MKPNVARILKSSILLIFLPIAIGQTGIQATLARPISYNSVSSPLEINYEPTFAITGHLVPSQYVELALPAGARVEEVFAHEGEIVSQGSVLVHLDSYGQQQAEIANAELEYVMAQQALDVLYQNVDVNLAKAEIELAQAEKAQAYAKDRLRSLRESKSPDRIAQAHANLLLAEKQLNQVKDDLRKAEQKYANKSNFIWMFINERQFKLKLTLARQKVAKYERKVLDAQDKYEKLLEPVDSIDLAVSVANLEYAEAHIAKAEREREKWLNGPDPDLLESAQNQLHAAKAALSSAQVDLANSQLIAPISGALVEFDPKPGEWLSAGKPVIRIANLSKWIVETEDIPEMNIASIQEGQPVRIHIEAYPDLVLAGKVSLVEQTFKEEEGDIFYRAKITLDQNDPRLLWGMSTQVELQTP